ncbi:MAG: glycosyltransferase [Sphingomonas phyllosphaerae]|uniref:glycosyltransferase n=1 Tax=Sphingomonas phyllosphaerae TaxID=257003 RepID=UPI002FFACC41
MKSRSLVVSAVNFSEGGPLTVLIDSLETAVATLKPDWQITALVHDEKLVADINVKAIAFPESKIGWLKRIKLEWIKFHDLFDRKPIDLWLSLHDITPRVIARRQAVYCHNPSPFYKSRLSETFYDPKFFIFNKLYMFVYRSFAKRNYAIIVQSDWMREEFRKAIGHENIIVARPTLHKKSPSEVIFSPRQHYLRCPTPQTPIRFLYPALPRVFKNIEVICEAVKKLSPDARNLVDIRLTFDGTENRWAAALARRYRNEPGISLIGRQNRTQMTGEYQACDVVLFPSRLETWGLPITEAKEFDKPLLLADRPYAHETVGEYDNLEFIGVNDVGAWADAIERIVRGTWRPSASQAFDPLQPYAADWPALWRLLTEGL